MFGKLTFRSVASAANPDSSGSTLVINKPTGTGNGELMIAIISEAEGDFNSITAPAGWTLLGSSRNSGNGYKLLAYCKISNSEGSSYTWTASGLDIMFGCILTYLYPNVSDPVNSIGTVSSSLIFSNTILSPVCTLNKYSTVLIISRADSAAASLTLESTFIKRIEIADASSEAQYANFIVGESKMPFFIGNTPVFRTAVIQECYWDSIVLGLTNVDLSDGVHR